MSYYIFDINKKPLGSESRSMCDFHSKSLHQISKQMNMFFRHIVQNERDDYEFLRDRAPTFEEHLEKVFAGSYFRIVNNYDDTKAKIPFIDLIDDSKRKLCSMDFQ